MNELVAIWAGWIKPSAGRPAVQWSILLALAEVIHQAAQKFRGGMTHVQQA